jgi:hypothetical protein
MPSTVGDAPRPAPFTSAGTRSTGDAVTPGAIAAKRPSEATSSGYESLEKSSETMKSSGTANAASSAAFFESVARYVAANRPRPMLTTRKATARALRPGCRASDSTASRTGAEERRAARPRSRRSGGRARAATTAATNAARPGRRASSTPVPPPDASSSGPARPRAKPTATAASAPRAPISSGPTVKRDTRVPPSKRARVVSRAVATAVAASTASPPEVRIEW